MSKHDKVFQAVTAPIMEMLENNELPPWAKNWNLGGMNMPRNPITPTVYSGINIFLLGMQGYGSPYWFGFKQTGKINAKVRKGQKGTAVVCWIPRVKETENEETGETETRKWWNCFYQYVWNIEQLEPKDDTGFKYNRLMQREMATAKEDAETHDPIEAAENILKEYKTMPGMVWGVNPCYRPGDDTIGMPELKNFKTPEDYYDAYFHEMSHSTMHPTRLNRMGENKLVYAEEELVAEMSSAFLCGIAGISRAVIENQAAYIKSWKKRIKEHGPELIINAAQKAQEATDFITNVTVISKLKDEYIQNKLEEARKQAA